MTRQRDKDHRLVTQALYRPALLDLPVSIFQIYYRPLNLKLIACDSQVVSFSPINMLLLYKLAKYDEDHLKKVLNWRKLNLWIDLGSKKA